MKRNYTGKISCQRSLNLDRCLKVIDEDKKSTLKYNCGYRRIDYIVLCMCERIHTHIYCWWWLPQRVQPIKAFVFLY